MGQKAGETTDEREVADQAETQHTTRNSSHETRPGEQALEADDILVDTQQAKEEVREKNPNLVKTRIPGTDTQHTTRAPSQTRTVASEAREMNANAVETRRAEEIIQNEDKNMIESRTPKQKYLYTMIPPGYLRNQDSAPDTDTNLANPRIIEPTIPNPVNRFPRFPDRNPYPRAMNTLGPVSGRPTDVEYDAIVHSEELRGPRRMPVVQEAEVPDPMEELVAALVAPMQQAGSSSCCSYCYPCLSRLGALCWDCLGCLP